ncbi:hypothetical protein [Sphaerisporangium dianthi]|uniref:Uncharacterized protein n=1 Tax=Sphaerisporangium dianthi TaxID=1436120 RepID=A0ABV9CNB8_9ACTN
MKVTPPPRDLKLLSESDERQRVAELAAEAFDDFTKIMKCGIPVEGAVRTHVSLLPHGTRFPTAKVVIQDTGWRRLNYAELTARAGRPNRDRYEECAPFAIATHDTEPEMSYLRLLAIFLVRRSHRGRFEELGLFGMGFKVSTVLAT